MAFISSIPISSNGHAKLGSCAQKVRASHMFCTRSMKRAFVSTHQRDLGSKSTLMMTASVGNQAVEFNLPINGGKMLSMDDLNKKADIVVLYFYPKDATSGCTVEAKDFRDLLPQFQQLNATVVGISSDSVESHDAFVQDLQLTFPLISDDGTLVDGYGAWKMKDFGTGEMKVINRSTFVIQKGQVVKEWRGVKSGGHAAEVLEAVKQL